MWYQDDDSNEPVIEFSYRSNVDGNSHTVEMRMTKDTEYYPRILDQFKYFLQSMGFNYIDGIVALDEKGKELKSSNDVF